MPVQPITFENLKEHLGYIVKKRRGYKKELTKIGKFFDTFEQAGFIKTGHTLKNETFSITKLADQYYKEMYGYCSYYGKRLQGCYEKIVKEI